MYKAIGYAAFFLLIAVFSVGSTQMAKSQSLQSKRRLKLIKVDGNICRLQLRIMNGSTEFVIYLVSIAAIFACYRGNNYHEIRKGAQ